MLVFSSCWGVKKNKPQKTRCRSLVNFDGRWVGRAEGTAGSVTSYWLRDLTCCTPRVGDVHVYMYAQLDILELHLCKVNCREASTLDVETPSWSYINTRQPRSQWTSSDEGLP